MKKIKTYISFLIFGLVIMIPLQSKAAGFSDVGISNPNYEAIMYLQEKGVIRGYDDGLFRPNNPVSRIELLKIIMNSKNLKTSFDNTYTFPDIESDTWYAPYVSRAYKEGYVNGNNGRFYPNNTVTKVESLKIIFNIFGITVDSKVNTNLYTDVPAGSWYAPFIKKAREDGYIDPPSGNYFNPNEPMNRASVSEVVYRIVDDLGIDITNVNNNPTEISGKIYTGPGTYTISIGDKLYDELNGKYIQLISENEYDGGLGFYFYDENGNKLDGNITKKTSSPYNGGWYEEPKEPLGPQLMNHYPDGEYRLKYISKDGENRYKVKVDYALQYVTTKAIGIKKILYVPVYLSDVRDETSDHWKRQKYIIEPALEDIQNYIRVKQEQYLGRQIMWFDFTIADYVIPSEPDTDFKMINYTNDTENRFDLVKKYTGYDPTDFDIIYFDIYTEDSSFYADRALYHQAYTSWAPYAVADFDINNNDVMRGQINVITLPGLHEILHNMGMHDIGRNQGKNELFYGYKFNNESQLCLLDECRLHTSPTGTIGEFQYIDDFIAHEIGWTDRNNNGILDVEEHGIDCSQDERTKYKFCEE